MSTFGAILADTAPASARRWTAVGFWVLFLALVAAAWTVLLAATLDVGGSIFAGPIGWFVAVCRSGGVLPDAVGLAAMWGVMTVAMMGPVALPYLVTFARLGRAGGRTPGGIDLAALAAGYLAVWGGFAVVAAMLQHEAGSGLLLDPEGRIESAWLVAGLLALAAGYQLSGFKTACLVRCRAPFTYFLAHWRSGRRGAFAMGMRQGAVCLACCWALMLLMFVGGVMNVLWMAGATILMLVERFPDSGNRLRNAVAVGLLAGALVASLRGVGVL